MVRVVEAHARYPVVVLRAASGQSTRGEATYKLHPLCVHVPVSRCSRLPPNIIGAVSVNWVRSQPRWSGMTLFTSPTLGMPDRYGMLPVISYLRRRKAVMSNRNEAGARLSATKMQASTATQSTCTTIVSISWHSIRSPKLIWWNIHLALSRTMGIQGGVFRGVGFIHTHAKPVTLVSTRFNADIMALRAFSSVGLSLNRLSSAGFL